MNTFSSIRHHLLATQMRGVCNHLRGVHLCKSHLKYHHSSAASSTTAKRKAVRITGIHHPHFIIASIQPTKEIIQYSVRRFSDSMQKNNGESCLPHEVMSRQSDFFGEAITFVKDIDESRITCIDKSIQEVSFKEGTNSNQNANMAKAVESFDGMALCIISRGASNIHTGNDGDGPDAKAMHSSAMAWSELLRCANEWNGNVQCTSPMLAVAAVAPLLAQGGKDYVHRIDKLLSVTRNTTGTPPSLWKIANNAASFRDAFISASDDDDDATPLLTPRERFHLHALSMLIQNNHRCAMGAYVRLLELYPGDLLGLSLALDVAYSLGDGEAARAAATNVSTYWSERDGGTLGLHPSQSGQTLASSLVAVGLSSSSGLSRAAIVESLVEMALARDPDGAGGTSVWALSHILGSEGRSSEMVSRLAMFDGTQLYQNCGYLNFHTRMAGYGGIALLDRRGAGSERSSLRLYDGGFASLLDYTGNNAEGIKNGGEEIVMRDMKVPRNVASDVVGSIFSGWFGSDDATTEKEDDPSLKEQDTVQRKRHIPRTLEDTLCWLPPSPTLLTQATSLLFRLTLVDGVSQHDQRWVDLQAAWKYSLEIENDANTQRPFEFMPMALLASSLLLDPVTLHVETLPPRLEIAMQGLHKMGKLLKLGQQVGNSSQMSSEWNEVLRDLAQARESCQRWEMPNGMDSTTYSPTGGDYNSVTNPQYPIGWDFDVRQFLEHGLCYAAVQVGDYESLCLARAICSEGTTLRRNCPELWWRYSVVLDMLGDEVAAENARAASVSLGSGEGGSTN